FFGRARELDAASLAASAGVNLSFHDDWKPELVDSGWDLVGIRDDDTARYGYAILRKKLLALIFVNFHVDVCRAALCGRPSFFDSIWLKEGRPQRAALTWFLLLAAACRAVLNGEDVNPAREASEIHAIAFKRIEGQGPHAVRGQLYVDSLPHVALVG